MGGKNLEGRQTMRSPAPGDAGLVGWQTAFRAAARASEGGAWKGPGGDTGHLCVPLAVHSLLWPPLQGSILHSGRNGAAREPASTRQRPPWPGGDQLGLRPLERGLRCGHQTEPGWALRVVVGRSGPLWAPVGLLRAALNGSIGLLAPCLPRFVDLWMAYGIVLSTGCCSRF